VTLRLDRRVSHSAPGATATLGIRFLRERSRCDFGIRYSVSYRYSYTGDDSHSGEAE